MGFILFLAVSVFVAEAEEEFIRIWPEKAVVEYGGSVVLNCSSNCEGIGFESNLKQVSAGNGTSWKAFNFTYGNDWNPEILCFAKCTSAITPPRTKITVYRAPKHVVLEVPKMEVGREYTLTCRVSNVAPIRNLTVTLFKGREKLLVKTFENHTDAKANNVTVTHNMTAQRADHGEEVTCHTALDLRPKGPFLEKAFGNESLMTAVFPMDPSLKTLPSIETHTKMTVTCDASGVFPAEEAQFVVWFAGERRNFSRSVSGDTVSARALVSASSAGEHKLICTVSLGPVTRTVEKTVDVYNAPVQLTVELLKSSPGQSWAYNLSCHVIRMVSHSNVTVTLFKGPERQHSQTFWNPTTPERANFTITHPMTLQPQDHGREANCHMTLDSSPYGEPLTSTIKLKTAETSKAIIVAAVSIAALAATLMGILICHQICVRGSASKTRLRMAKQI
ncbi:intercellular adhesion molecule 1-like [Elgaria multicarinata webbii]|uniref:intercellular adhesion molecule 1-like n=1 Tax=Elgaria multicarinata webbii TaxID=159646 RepID=UPI002FCD24F0